MSRVSVRDRWYAEVIRTRLVTGACRELLSLIAVRHMSAGGVVAVSRETLAEELGLPLQQVSNRIAQATAAGFLRRLDGGHNGRRARYQAVFPEPVGSTTAEPTELRRLTISFKQHADVGSTAAEPTEGLAAAVGSTSVEPQRARARAHLPLPTEVLTTTAGDVPPPADRDRGTPGRPLAAANGGDEQHGQDRLGDYLDGRTRHATQVGQGNHRPRARRVNGSPIR